MRRFQPIKTLWGLPKFLSHNTFKEASNGYLVDDKCVLGAEIFIVQRQAIGECLSMVKSNDLFKRQWNICNFSKLRKDWLSEEFTVGGYKWYFFAQNCMFYTYCSVVPSLILLIFLCRQLKLYPKGEADNKECDIAIYLHSVDSNNFDHHQKLKAKHNINLKNQKNGGHKKLSCKANNIVFFFKTLISFLHI